MCFSQGVLFTITHHLCVRFCMVCTFVQEDNPRAKARGVSPVQTQNHTITCLFTDMQLHFVHFEIFVV